MVAIQRNRKKEIECLMGPTGLVYDNGGMLNVAADLYKNLFSKEDRLEVDLDDNFWDEIEKVTTEENELLQAPFSETEIKDALFNCYAEGAPGPDGLSFLFYQSSGM